MNNTARNLNSAAKSLFNKHRETSAQVDQLVKNGHRADLFFQTALSAAACEVAIQRLTFTEEFIDNELFDVPEDQLIVMLKERHHALATQLLDAIFLKINTIGLHEINGVKMAFAIFNSCLPNPQAKSAMQPLRYTLIQAILNRPDTPIQVVASELYESISGKELFRETDPENGEDYLYRAGKDCCKVSPAIHPEVASMFKSSPKTDRFLVSTGWTGKNPNTDVDFHLDITAFGCAYHQTASGNETKLLSEDYVVSFNSEIRTEDRVNTFIDKKAHLLKAGLPCSPCLGIIHTGNKITGDGGGVSGSLIVDPNNLPKNLREISFIVTVRDAESRRQNFGQVNHAFVQIQDEETGETLVYFNLDHDFHSETSVQLGSLVRKDDGKWGFLPIGTGYRKCLSDFVTYYTP